jgi:hypothetical protein
MAYLEMLLSQAGWDLDEGKLVSSGAGREREREREESV